MFIHILLVLSRDIMSYPPLCTYLDEIVVNLAVSNSVAAPCRLCVGIDGV